MENKYKKIIKNSISEVLRVRNRKKKITFSLRNYKKIVAPGIWIISYNFGRKIYGSKLPSNFKEAKKNRVDSDKRPFVSKVIKFIDIVIPPYFTFIDGKNNTTSNSELINKQAMVMYTSRDTPIFIDSQKNELLRFFNNSDDYKNEVETRRIFSNFFNLPNFKTFKSINAISEEIVIGRPFNSVDTLDRTDLVRNFIDDYCSYCAKNELKYAPSIWENVILTIEQLEMPDQYRVKFNKYKQDIINNSKKWPFILGHADLYYKNIIINNRIMYLIDFDQSSELPFFYDLFNIICSEALHGRVDLIDSLNKGFFDKELRDLLKATNIREEVIDLELYLWAYIFYDAYRHPDKNFQNFTY